VNKPLRPGYAKVLRFILAGVPSFALAVPLNYVLTTAVGMSKPAAYAVVMVFQVSVIFWFCRWFVFDTDRERSLWKSFLVFFNGILLFRLADWALYSFLVTRLGLPFLAVQLFNGAAFALLKFEFSRRVLERREKS
jgi:putative flippase GtrA